MPFWWDRRSFRTRRRARRCELTGINADEVPVEIDRELGPLGDDRTAVDLVERGDSADEAVVEQPMTGLEIAQLTDCESPAATFGELGQVGAIAQASLGQQLTQPVCRHDRRRLDSNL